MRDRTTVIHNSSVWEQDIVSKRRFSTDLMTIVYCGRLIQYQKRILDVIDVADALAKRDVPFVINLIEGSLLTSLRLSESSGRGQKRTFVRGASSCSAGYPGPRFSPS